MFKLDFKSGFTSFDVDRLNNFDDILGRFFNVLYFSILHLNPDFMQKIGMLLLAFLAFSPFINILDYDWA